MKKLILFSLSFFSLITSAYAGDNVVIVDSRPIHTILYYVNNGKVTLYYGKDESLAGSIGAAENACTNDKNRDGSSDCKNMPYEIKIAAGESAGVKLSAESTFSDPSSKK